MKLKGICKSWVFSYCLIFSVVFMTSCQGEDSNTISTTTNTANTTSDTRSFHMGFTTWKYAYDTASQTDIYNKVSSSSYGDIVGLHYMDGIPWNLGDTSLYPPENLASYYDASGDTAYLLERISATAPLSTLYLAIDAINDTRNGIAKRRSDGAAAGITLGSNEAKYAYTNFAIYALWLIYSHYTSNGYSLPKVYLNYASEASEMIINSYDATSDSFIYTEWDGLVALGSFVYPNLKNNSHSQSAFADFVRNTSLMVSVALKSPEDSIPGNLTKYDNVAGHNVVNDKMEVVRGKFPEIHSAIDMVGVSSYGYIFYDHQYSGTNGSNEDVNRGDPAQLPSNWLSQIESVSGGKPIAITETGWIAENYDVSMNGSYIITSDQARQNTFTRMMFEESDKLKAAFVIWFTLADFDPLWDQFGSAQTSGLTWRDTGLFAISPLTHVDYLNQGATLSPRTAWSTWQEWLSRELP